MEFSFQIQFELCKRSVMNLQYSILASTHCSQSQFIDSFKVPWLRTWEMKMIFLHEPRLYFHQTDNEIGLTRRVFPSKLWHLSMNSY